MLAGRVRTGVWVILAIALALRVATVAFTWNTPLNLDPEDFSRTAQSIADGHGYPQTNRAPGGGPSAFRPPAYPVLLAGVYAIAGQAAPPVGRLAGAVLGTLSVALIGLIALRVWGSRVAMLALGIAAVAPPLVILSTGLISEALFVPLVLGAVLSALEARRSQQRYRWAIVTGVLVGLAALTRTNGLLLLLPFFVAFAPTRSLRHARSWTPSLVVVLAALLTLVPWTVRNWTVFHHFIPISDESGYTLAGTYNQVSRANRKEPALWIEAEHGASPEYARILGEATAKRWNELTYGNHLLAQSVDEIKSDPEYIFKVGFWNTVRMFDLGDVHFGVHNLHDTGIPLAPALLVINSSPLLIVLAFGGLLTRTARKAPIWLWLVPACLWLTVFVTGFIRFRSPIDPFLVMLAAVAVADVWGQLAKAGRRPSSAAHQTSSAAE